ncbi:MAG: DUF308 domain-containing protein [Muribaculaceae bacterium]|nr:DUF308 domain-containing protein [Muribaculaceae bacterium]
MKNLTSLLSYIAGLAIGVLLLVFYAEASVLQGIVVALGILVALPSLIMIIRLLIPRKTSEGEKIPTPWYGVIVAIVGLAFGLWLLIDPAFFVDITVYTLALVLILSGISGWMFVSQNSRPYGANIWWYCVPFLTILGGIILCILGAAAIGKIANLVTGILLVMYAVNGFASFGREAKNNELKHTDRKIENKTE